MNEYTIFTHSKYGRAMLSVGVSALAARVVQTFIMQNVYLATLNWYPGFTFMLLAALTFVCCAIVLWVDVVVAWTKRCSAPANKPTNEIADTAM